MSTAPQARCIDVDDRVERLLVVSDLHGFLEPLRALDRVIAEMPGRVQVVAAGDLVMGGPDPAGAVEWARTRAGDFAILGNHDEVALMGGEGRPPAHTEAGSFQRLSAEQVAYLRGLPDLLDLRWRGIRVRIIHGHRTYGREDATFTGLARYEDPAFALTVIGHTHDAFAPAEGDPRVADSGATCKFVFDCRREDGTFVPRPDEPDPAPDSDMYGTFLLLTIKGGRLEAEVGRFDYDRQAAMRRALEQDALDASPG